MPQQYLPPNKLTLSKYITSRLCKRIPEIHFQLQDHFIIQLSGIYGTAYDKALKLLFSWMIISVKQKLTGEARAASRIEPTPCSGDCKRPRSFSTRNAKEERQEGISRMMLVSTAPGSAALRYQVKWDEKE